jgi:hypothetical protein
MSYTQTAVTIFEAHPYEWIDGLWLAQRLGAYGWRSRISNARKRGLTITNKQVRHPDGRVQSFYSYIPHDAPRHA